MFLVDKYQKDCNYLTCHQDLIEKLLDTFDSHQSLYKKVYSVLKPSVSNDKELKESRLKDLKRYQYNSQNNFTFITYRR